MLLTILTAVAGRFAAIPEMEKQREAHAHEQQTQRDRLDHERRMQRDRLDHVTAKWNSVIGATVLVVAMIAISAIALALLVMLERGIINEKVFAQAAVIVGAVTSTVAVTKKASQQQKSPEAQ